MAKKILVVDDEKDFLAIMKKRLESSKYHVLTAASGKEALKKIKADKPDAVLLDILMPGLDGFEVLWMIRRYYKDLPVFMITAFSNEERFKLAEKLNASGFIVKTGNLKEEVRHIDNVLSVAGRYRASRG